MEKQSAHGAVKKYNISDLSVEERERINNLVDPYKEKNKQSFSIPITKRGQGSKKR